MRTFTTNEILAAYKRKGYPLLSRPMEMNIFGIRNSDPLANTFDDYVGIIYRNVKGQWVSNLYPATTDPGEYARLNPMNHDGTAIIVPGFHLKAYKKGFHKGQPAMEQLNPMVYVRDNNKDKVLDFLYKITGYKPWKQNGKTNIHRAGKNSKLVDKWSYGCQVFANEIQFNYFLSLIDMHLDMLYPNEFDYVLFEKEDFAA